MSDRTQEFLKKCKDAGYEKVTIFVSDNRVPISKKIEKESNGTYWGRSFVPPPEPPFKVVCGCPERLGKCPGLPRNIWPKMWAIVKELGLTAGLSFGGFGSGDSHDINPVFVPDLKAGYYDLSEIKA
jgi:hypothetical protein